MSAQNPFDTSRALAAHRGFAESAHGKPARKITMGVDTEKAVLQQVEINKARERKKSAPKARNRLECPHCDEPCIIRSSKRMSKLTREYSYQCPNIDCGHTFVASMEVRHTVSPSGTPDPSVVLPVPDKMRRDVIRAQMDTAPSVPYTPLKSKPVTGDLFVGLPLPPPRE